MSKIKVLILLSALVFIGCGTVKEEVSVSKSQIQEIVAKKFPYEKNAIIAKFKLHSPQVYFKDKNIGMKLEYVGSLLNKEIKGHIDFIGRITYRSKSAAFYLDNLQLVDITVDNSSFSNKEKLKSIVSNILNNYMNDYPVYSLNPNDFKQNAAKLLLKDISVKGDSLVLTLSI
ncbi:MAG: DUF1439 domain-containing protein [Proteobacteria bacterium]|nr:DUF1439 domain-containing protein [Pseudomonadota bacterium]